MFATINQRSNSTTIQCMSTPQAASEKNNSSQLSKEPSSITKEGYQLLNTTPRNRKCRLENTFSFSGFRESIVVFSAELLSQVPVTRGKTIANLTVGPKASVHKINITNTFSITKASSNNNKPTIKIDGLMNVVDYKTSETLNTTEQPVVSFVTLPANKSSRVTIMPRNKIEDIGVRPRKQRILNLTVNQFQNGTTPESCKISQNQLERSYYYSADSKIKGKVLFAIDNILARDILHNPCSVINGTFNQHFSHGVGYQKITDDFGTFEVGYDQSSLSKSSKWSYTIFQSKKPEFEKLVKNSTQERNFTIVARDGTKKTTTLLLKGSNRAPTFSGIYTGHVTEERFQTMYYNDAPGMPLKRAEKLFTGYIVNISDPDPKESELQKTRIKGAIGWLETNKKAWMYFADNKHPSIQALTTNETLTETFVIHSVDATPQNVTINIHGTDDPSVISGDTNNIATYDASQNKYTVNGKLNIIDIDTSDHPYFEQGDYQGKHGLVYLQKNGRFIYTTNAQQSDLINKFKSLSKVTDIIPVIASDGSSKNISITLGRSEAIIDDQAMNNLTTNRSNDLIRSPSNELFTPQVSYILSSLLIGAGLVAILFMGGLIFYKCYKNRRNNSSSLGIKRHDERQTTKSLFQTNQLRTVNANLIEKTNTTNTSNHDIEASKTFIYNEI